MGIRRKTWRAGLGVVYGVREEELDLACCVARLGRGGCGGGGGDGGGVCQDGIQLGGPGEAGDPGQAGANPRVQKYVVILADAKQAGLRPKKVAAAAVELVGMKGDAAKLTADTMVRNLTIADRLGCLDAAGLQDIRSSADGAERAIQGDQLSVDHIIPRAVAPELENVIANLELMPLRMNEGKSARVGDRQRDLARKLNKAGLLSKEGLEAVVGSR